MLSDANSDLEMLLDRFPWVPSDLRCTSTPRWRRPAPGVISKPRIHHQKSLSWSLRSSAAYAGAATASGHKRTSARNSRIPGKGAGTDLVPDRESEDRRPQLAFQHL